MALLQVTRDVQAFLLRVTASLERVDAAVAEVQLLMRTTTATVQELRSLLDAFRAAAGKPPGGGL